MKHDEPPGVEWHPEPAAAELPTEPDLDWSSSEATVPIAPILAGAVDRYPPACAQCGGQLGVDGYCLTCGAKAKTLREHYELTPADWVAGVCDIGQAHARNEDAIDCQASPDRAVLVVSDGVTTSQGSDVAAMVAARTACDYLWTEPPAGLGTLQSRTAAMRAQLVAAVARANSAVVTTTDPLSRNAAAATVAIAVVTGQRIYAANLGDSRVYWLPDDGAPAQLTKDHSLAQAGIDMGSGRAEAEASPFAHTITKWLGADATDLSPNLADLTVTVPGWLIVCSDGLWNYISEASAFQARVVACGATTPAELAGALVGWANDQGGHDNISVVCARLDPLAAPATPADDVTATDEAQTQAGTVSADSGPAAGSADDTAPGPAEPTEPGPADAGFQPADGPTS